MKYLGPERKQYEKRAKDKAIRDAGRKVNKKEAEKLKKRGVSAKDIKRANPGARLSRGGTKVFSGKPQPKKKSSSSRKSSSESSYESDYMSQQSDIADMMKEFQIAQQQQMQQYEKMLAQQAAQAKKEQEEQLKMLQIQQQNTASAAQTPNFQLQGAGTTPKLGAAQQFRRRLGTQFGTGSPYTGLAQISAGMVNV